MWKFLKKHWKFSRTRFYINNALWNYGFWLKCERIYKTVTFKINDDDFFVDEALRMHYKKKIVTKKRFVGYMYKGSIYNDNPGMPIEDRETWKKWKKKGLID